MPPKQHTILNKGADFFIKSCLKQCPFCEYSNSVSHMVQLHVRRHLDAAVKYKGLFLHIDDLL